MVMRQVGKLASGAGVRAAARLDRTTFLVTAPRRVETAALPPYHLTMLPSYHLTI